MTGMLLKWKCGPEDGVGIGFKQRPRDFDFWSVLKRVVWAVNLTVQRRGQLWWMCKSGGLCENHAAETGHLSTCLKTEENQENFDRGGRSQDLPVARWLLASSPANKTWKSPKVSPTNVAALLIIRVVWPLQLHGSYSYISVSRSVFLAVNALGGLATWSSAGISLVLALDWGLPARPLAISRVKWAATLTQGFRWFA